MTNQMPVAWMYDWETPEGEFVKGMTTDDFASFAGEPIGRISNIRPLYFAQPQYRQEPVAYANKNGDIVWVDEERHIPNWTDYFVIPLYGNPTPCQTCEALARSVMLDQTGRDK